jgi:MFS family permease
MCLGIAILTILMDTQNTLEVVLLFVMRFIMCMFWAIMYIYLAELYPTRVRSLAFGWASAVGTVGSFASPYVVLMSDKLGLNRWIIPGVVGLIATLGVIPLP